MKIAVLPGDGIGTEIVAEAVRVLDALGLKIESETALVGGVVHARAGRVAGERRDDVRVDVGGARLPLGDLHQLPIDYLVVSDHTRIPCSPPRYARVSLGSSANFAHDPAPVPRFRIEFEKIVDGDIPVNQARRYSC